MFSFTVTSDVNRLESFTNELSYIHNLLAEREKVSVTCVSHGMLHGVLHDMPHGVLHDMSHDVSHDMLHDMSHGVLHNLLHDMSHNMLHDMSGSVYTVQCTMYIRV